MADYDNYSGDAGFFEVVNRVGDDGFLIKRIRDFIFVFGGIEPGALTGGQNYCGDLRIHTVYVNGYFDLLTTSL
jgi:hypothetical protein